MYEWARSSCDIDQRVYVFGNQVRPKWVNSCYSRSVAQPEPVQSYPRDESPLGVFDLSGSQFEWTLDWWDEGAGSRRLAGGSWARPQRGFFKIWGGLGSQGSSISDETGFRLVLRLDTEER